MQDILLTQLCYETSGDAEHSRELLIDSHLRYLNLMHHSKNTLQGIFGLVLASNFARICVLGSDACLILADVGLSPPEIYENQRSEIITSLDVLLDSDGLDLNKARGVSRLKSTKLIHRGLLFIVKTLSGQISETSSVRKKMFLPRNFRGPRQSHCPCKA